MTLPLPNNIVPNDDPTIAGLSGGNIVPGVANQGAAQGVSTAPIAVDDEGNPGSDAGSQPGTDNASVGQHVLHGLSGILSHLGAGLEGAANVGTAPKGAGALYGFSKGAQGYADVRRQQTQDAQKKAQQQFENDEKTKADKRADVLLQNNTASTNAEVALHNAQLIGATHADQQAQALAPYMIAEEKSKLDNINNQRTAAEVDLKKHLIEAGVSADELEEDFQTIAQLPPGTAQNASAGKVMGVGNGQAAANGEDKDGVHLISNPQEVLGRKLQKDTQILTGYQPNKNGGFDPIKKTVSAGTTLSSVLAAHDAAMDQLSQQQDQLSKSTKQRLENVQIRNQQAEADQHVLAGQLIKKQLDDPDSLTPKEVHELQKSGQSESSKSQKDYNTFLQSANSIQGSIRASKNGNELASAVLPLQGTLFITTAEGVKRINETELSAVKGSGDIVRRGVNAYQAFINGDTSQGTKNDLANLIDVYKTAKYQQYINNEAVTAKNYRLGDKESVFDQNGKPTTLGAAQEKLNPTAQGDAGKVHAKLADFAQATATKEHGTLYTDDGKTWYKPDGSIYQPPAR